MGLLAKKGCNLKLNRQQIFPLPDLSSIFFRRLRLHISTICDRVEMGKDELADTSLFRHLAALAGMEMGRTRAVGWERAIEHSKAGIHTQPDHLITILSIS